MNKKFIADSRWHTEFTKSECFADLNRMVDLDDWPSWPSADALNTLFDQPIRNLNNKEVQFSQQNSDQNYSAEEYERVIYETGQVPTRAQSYHDVFGALVWCLFPKSKAIINAHHINELNNQTDSQRSQYRNALTLLDECGVLVITTNHGLVEALRGHRWSEAFIEHRELWGMASQQGIWAVNFGHGNYEMMTKPFLGLTGKMLVLPISCELLSLPVNVRYRYLDDKLSAMLQAQVLAEQGLLTPLPLLGIPGWYSDNEQADFYNNKEYFREKRN